MKVLTADQMRARKAQAARFTRDVLRDEDRAAEIERESLEDYASRRKFEIINPTHRRVLPMPSKTSGPTKADLENLLDQIEEKADEALDPECTREEIVATMKEIYDLASGEEPDDDSDEAESDEDDEDGAEQ